MRVRSPRSYLTNARRYDPWCADLRTKPASVRILTPDPTYDFCALSYAPNSPRIWSLTDQLISVNSRAKSYPLAPAAAARTGMNMDPHKILYSSLESLELDPEGKEPAQLDAYIIAKLWIYTGVEPQNGLLWAIYRQDFQAWTAEHFWNASLAHLQELVYSFLQESSIYVNVNCSSCRHGN